MTARHAGRLAKADAGSSPPIFTAVQNQLGLKLEPSTGPVDVLVIDHVDVHYVSMDFTKDSLLNQLAAAGYSEQQTTFFLWEGVVFYLPESAVKDTLHFVRDHAAPGSRIAFNYQFSRNPDVNNPHSLYARWGEPWIFGVPDDGAGAYVRREGLDVISDTTRVENICIASVPKSK